MRPKHVAAIGVSIKRLCVDELRPYYCVFYRHDGVVTP